MRNSPIKIRCSVCGEGHLVPKLVEHDVGALLGLAHVIVSDLPVLACSRCDAVAMYGGMIEQVTLHLAVFVLAQSELQPDEVRFLRKLLGDTQEELARRLGVVRATVNRWENATEPTTGPEAYAIRSHAFFRLRGSSEQIEAAAPAFVAPPTKPRPRKRSYRIDGAALAPPA